MRKKIITLFIMLCFTGFNTLHAQDSDGDGITNINDLDDDNDGIPDTSEGYCTNSLFDAGWFGNAPLSTQNQDGLWASAPSNPSSITYAGAHNNAVVATAAPFTFGTGLTFSTNGGTLSRWLLTGVDATTLSAAKTGNDYAQYSFTTPASMTGYREFSKFGWADDNDNGTYKVGVEVSTNGFLSAGTLLLQDFQVVDGSGSGYEYKATTTLINLVRLLPNTTYTFRVYIYGAAAASTTLSYEDFQFGTCLSADTDGDGTPDFLDLDSDNDGCLDAIEGDENVTISMLVNAGGTVTVGTGSAANQNLCATVNCMNAQGVPNMVNSGGTADIGNDVGQGAGSSQNTSINACICYKPSTISGTVLNTPYGISSLGRAGGISNWPMVRKGAWTAMESKTKGFVPNRLTTVQKNALVPAEGMMVYDTTLDCLSIYDGSGWKCFSNQTCPDNL
ncbi:hypothetical protein [Chryseobacterium sp. OV279]|uniref:hypothetical protein n=1 Tax=Chryseobacterium sp. OV279 TaxID=1500285 RepID=UPI0009181DDE|nr:hypothetical protein [Chryseobacterium sp. OV279]SHF79398.1 hypothetical protein SAMN02787100_2610 [Chryseobacterium sp. OV279]